MIDTESIEALVEQYATHEWILRRVVLTNDEYERLSKPLGSHFDTAVKLGVIDAVWFSRVNKGSEAWELRRLAGAPFAMVRVIDIDATESEREAVLNETEIEMANAKMTRVEH